MKVTYYDEERDYGFWDSVFIRLITTIAFTFITIVLIIVVYGNASVSKITYTSVKVERIPVKEMVKRYIDSLPVPKAEYPTLIVQEEDSSEEGIDSSNVNQTIEYVEPKNLIQEVEDITPITTKLNTSAYCSCEICCGKTDGKTASGKMATTWHTVAAGKSYPMGTIIYIPDLADKPNGGWFVVEDRGGAISNEKLDVFLNTHEEAIKFGRRSLEVYIYIPNN